MIKIYIFLCILLFAIIFRKKEHVNFNAPYMMQQYPKYNLEYDLKNKRFIHQLTKNKLSTRGQFNSRISSHICNNKEKTLIKLKENEIPVTNFYLWNKDVTNKVNLENIKKLKINYPVVAKPTEGTQGRDVMTDINDSKELLEKVSSFDEKDKILVEEQVVGRNYRILVFNGKIIDVIERIPPIIKGDGINTLEKLIELYEISQKEKGFYGVYNYDINLINSQGFKIDDIIPKNKEILLTKTVNFHNGSQLKRIDITKIHPLNIGMFIKINKVLRLDLSGIDYMAKSLEDPYYMDGAIIEVNDGPDMKIHYVADKNEKNFAVSKFLKTVEQIIR